MIKSKDGGYKWLWLIGAAVCLFTINIIHIKVIVYFPLR